MELPVRTGVSDTGRVMVDVEDFVNALGFDIKQNVEEDGVIPRDSIINALMSYAQFVKNSTLLADEDALEANEA